MGSEMCIRDRIYIKESIDFTNKLTPTRRHTTVKVFLMSLFPFKLDKCAPKYPPVKDPKIRITNKLVGI